MELRKVLIVTTDDSTRNKIIKLLKEAGVSMEGVTIRPWMESGHVTWISVHRPELIIFDAQMQQHISWSLHTDFANAVSRYDMPCTFFSINGDPHLLGVTPLKKFSDIEERRKITQSIAQ